MAHHITLSLKKNLSFLFFYNTLVSSSVISMFPWAAFEVFLIMCTLIMVYLVFFKNALYFPFFFIFEGFHNKSFLLPAPVFLYNDVIK